MCSTKNKIISITLSFIHLQYALILVRVAVDPDTSPETLDVIWAYTLYGMAVHRMVHLGEFSIANPPASMILRCGKKPENPEGEFAHELHTDTKTSSGLNQICCEISTLPTAPPRA